MAKKEHHRNTVLGHSFPASIGMGELWRSPDLNIYRFDLCRGMAGGLNVHRGSSAVLRTSRKVQRRLSGIGAQRPIDVLEYIVAFVMTVLGKRQGDC